MKPFILIFLLSFVLNAKGTLLYNKFQETSKDDYELFMFQHISYKSCLFLKVNEESFVDQYFKNKQNYLYAKNYTISKYQEKVLSEYPAVKIDLDEALDYKYVKLIEDSMYVQVAFVAAIGAVFALPESVSNWDKESILNDGITKKWSQNVAAGPVIDQDDFVINYIGHPVSGAFYYNFARGDGLNIGESFAFSVLMSSVIWEYGYEAFAEIPSIQDLISTPVVGSLMGEGLYQIETSLDENEGKIWGSSALGNVAYVFLNPMASISRSLKGAMGKNNTHATVDLMYENYTKPNQMYQENSLFQARRSEMYYGVYLTIY